MKYTGSRDGGRVDLAQDEPRQVPAHQGVDLVVGLGQHGLDGGGVQAGQPQERRQDIGVAGQDVQGLAGREELGVVDDERHVDRLLVGLVPLLVHAAVGAQHLPVVGGEDDDGVAVELPVDGAQGVQDLLDLAVHVLLHLVVELVELEVVLGRLEGQGVGVNVALLAVRLGGEVLPASLGVLGGIEQRVGHRGAGQLPDQVEVALGQGEVAPQGDVVGVDERGDHQPGPPVVLGAELAEEADRLLGEPLVAALLAGRRGRPRVERVPAVGLGADPSAEPELVQPVGVQVVLLLGRVGHPVVVEAQDLVAGAGDQEVGVGEVPLALVEGVVAAGSEVVAHGGHGVGVQPELVVLERLLGHSGRLGHAVEGRVVPGEE